VYRPNCERTWSARDGLSPFLRAHRNVARRYRLTLGAPSLRTGRTAARGPTTGGRIPVHIYASVCPSVCMSVCGCAGVACVGVAVCRCVRVSVWLCACLYVSMSTCVVVRRQKSIAACPRLRPCAHDSCGSVWQHSDISLRHEAPWRTRQMISSVEGATYVLSGRWIAPFSFAIEAGDADGSAEYAGVQRTSGHRPLALRRVTKPAVTDV
jgi:hypothetical protein